MTKAKHYKDIDRILRAGCMEMGTAAAVAARPLTKAEVQKAVVRNTVSQSWRLGRAVVLARKDAQIGRVGEIIVDALGGTKTARVLFAGKVTEVGRRLHKGHSHGEIVIQALAAEDEEAADGDQRSYQGVMKSELHGTISADMVVPFMNENLMCKHIIDGKTEVSPASPRSKTVPTPPDCRWRPRSHHRPRCAKRQCPRYPGVQIRPSRSRSRHHGCAAVDGYS